MRRAATFSLNNATLLPLLLLLLSGLMGDSQGHVLTRRDIGAAPSRADQIPVAVVQEAEPQIVERKQEQLSAQLAQAELKATDETQQISEEQAKRTEAKLQEKLDSNTKPAQSAASELPIAQTAEEVKKEEPAAEPTAEVAVEPDSAPIAIESEGNEGEAAIANLRQAAVTQSTPTQGGSTTQQNFVQQLIQNSPIGQFLNQFNQPQQQQLQQQQSQQVQGDQPAAPAPAPTVPGFLNPAVAITSAQQVVQNAAQSVVNSTTQAFQGIQQFASNLGNQFQNTLSGLTGQQQQNAQPTTPRPPGPIQSFVSNFIGGNNATASANPPQQQQQQPQQGPFQGIINFLQGGNRPQNANTPAVAASPANKPSDIAEKPVDDKIDPVPAGVDLKEEQEQEAQPSSEPEQDETANEVRNSAETLDASFEEVVPVEEVIVVNGDAEQRAEAAKKEQQKQTQTPVVAA